MHNAAVQRGRVPPSQHPMFAAAAGQMAAAFAAGNGMSLTAHPHHSYLSGFVSMLLRAEPYPPPAAYAAASRAPTGNSSTGQTSFTSQTIYKYTYTFMSYIFVYLLYKYKYVYTAIKRLFTKTLKFSKPCKSFVYEFRRLLGRKCFKGKSIYCESLR